MVDIFHHVPVVYVGSDPGNIHVEDYLKQLISYLCLLDEGPIRNTLECVLHKIDESASRDLVDTREILSSAFALVDFFYVFDASKLEQMMDASDRAVRLIEEEDIDVDPSSHESWNSFSKQISEAAVFLFLNSVIIGATRDTQKQALQMIERILLSKNSTHVKKVCSLMSSLIERRDIACLPLQKLLSSLSDVDLILRAMSAPQFVVALVLAGVRNNCFIGVEKDFLYSISCILDAILQCILSEPFNCLEDISWACVIQPLTLFSCLVIESGATPRVLNIFLNKLEVLLIAFHHCS